MRGSERHGRAVRLRYIEEHLTTRWAHQRRKHRFGRVAVICNQLADLAARAARPNDAPANQAPVADQCAPDMAGRGDPGVEKCRSRRRKHRSVVSRDEVEGHFGHRHSGRRGLAAWRHPTAITDVVVGKHEAGFAIVILLRHYTVEPDCSRSRARHARLPDAQAESTAEQIRPYDIEAEEGKVLVVVYHRENGSRRARKLAEQESIWSGGSKARSIT